MVVHVLFQQIPLPERVCLVSGVLWLTHVLQVVRYTPERTKRGGPIRITTCTTVGERHRGVVAVGASQRAASGAGSSTGVSSSSNKSTSPPRASSRTREPNSQTRAESPATSAASFRITRTCFGAIRMRQFYEAQLRVRAVTRLARRDHRCGAGKRLHGGRRDNKERERLALPRPCEPVATFDRSHAPRARRSFNQEACSTHNLTNNSILQAPFHMGKPPVLPQSRFFA